MNKAKTWLNLFMIIFSVSSIGYFLIRPEFPWYFNPLFPTLVPVATFLIGWVVCELYINLLSEKITQKFYRYIFSVVLIMASIIAAYPFRMSADSGQVFGVGFFLAVYSNFLFSLLVENDSSKKAR